MELIHDEIKTTLGKEWQVKKEQEYLKSFEKGLAKKKRFAQFKLKAELPSNLAEVNERSKTVEGITFITHKKNVAKKMLLEEDEKKRLSLNPALLDKIEKLYMGNEHELSQVVNKKQVINEILDTGRLDFLKTERKSKDHSSQFPPPSRKSQTKSGMCLNGDNMPMLINEQYGRVAMNIQSAKNDTRPSMILPKCKTLEDKHKELSKRQQGILF